MRSKSSVLKALWLFSVVVLVSAAVYHCVYLVKEHGSDPNVLTISSKFGRLSNTVEDPTHFPDVTACNLNPFSGDAAERIAERNITTVREYYEQIIAANISHFKYDHMLSSHGYFANIGQWNAEWIGHDTYSFVSRAFVSKDVAGLRGGPADWRKYGYIQDFTHYMFYRCYTFRYNATKSKPSLVDGLSVTLHLNNFYEEHYEYFDIEKDQGQHKGALIVVHEPGTFPNVQSKGIFLPPGRLSDVKLELVAHDRIEDKYPCMEPGQKVAGWEYSRTACISVCLEREVRNMCSCIDLFGLNVLGESEPDTIYCQKLDSEYLNKRFECAQQARERVLDRCLAGCHKPCHELEYLPYVSQAAWPPKPLSKHFYEDVISGRQYEARYHELKEVMVGNTSSFEHRSHAEKIVMENFLHFNIYVADFSYLEYQMTPRVSAFNLVAQLGGALNLWAGITVIVFVEALDFVCNIFLEWQKRRTLDVQS